MRGYKNKLPNYVDGNLEIFEVKHIGIEDYQKDVLKSTGKTIWFETLAVYDRTKFEAKSRGIEIIKKLRLPPTNFEDYKFIKINDKFYTIENVSEIVDSRDGFPKTDITLSRYQESYEVIQ